MTTEEFNPLIIGRPQSMFGKLPYRQEQKAMDTVLLDVARGVAMALPEESEAGDLPIGEELAFVLELAPEYLTHEGKISAETRSNLASKFLCRARNKLKEVFP